MNVRCPSCSTVFRVDPAKVPERGVRARCSVCSAVFPVQRETAPSASPPEPVVATPAAAAVAEAPPRVEAVNPIAPPARPPETFAAPAAPPAPPVSRPAAPRVAPPAAPLSSPAQPLAPPAIPGVRPPVMRPSAPVMPVMPPVAAPAASPALAPGGPEAAVPAPSAAPPASRPGVGDAAARRQVNPFLAQDPSAKARRLARALVSDMVVYHPAKRREALRAGNLRSAFEEEINKSWEEYVEQVGRELAEGTPHFRDALNEILGDGSQIF